MIRHCNCGREVWVDIVTRSYNGGAYVSQFFDTEYGRRLTPINFCPGCKKNLQPLAHYQERQAAPQ